MAAVQVRSYFDYRSYLADYIAFREQQHRGFSVRQLCRKIGLSTDNYVHRIIRRQRNLSLSLAERFIPALGLKGPDADYFRALVGTECARTDAERQHYFRIADRLVMKSDVPRRVDNGILRHWYLGVIWELASCPSSDMTPESLVKHLSGQVTKAQATEALNFLVAAGYLELRQDGRYEKIATRINTSDGVADLFVRLNHEQMLDAARRSLGLPLDKRLFYGLTMAIESTRLGEVQTRVAQFLESLRDELSSHEIPDSVYRVNLQAFPLATVSPKTTPAICSGDMKSYEKTHDLGCQTPGEYPLELRREGELCL